MSKNEKILYDRVSKLYQRVHEMTHYYKVRCVKRNVLSGKMRDVIQLSKRLVNLEKNLKKSFGRYPILKPSSRTRHAHSKLYPMFATRKEIQRIRQYFSRDLNRIKKPIKGKSYLTVTDNERAKLIRIAREDDRHG